MENNLNEELKEKIEKMIKEENLELIDFKLSSYGKGYSLRCLIDYTAGGITIDKCAQLNARIFNLLDEDKSLGEDFTVEVNSPGLDYPLRNYRDFLRSKGSIVGVWLNNPVDSKTYLEGEIIDSNERSITLKAKDKTYNLEPVNIKIGKARLDLQKPRNGINQEV